MAGKSKTVYVCSSCGYETPKWLGKCPDCGEWATLEEQIKQEITTKSNNKAVRSIQNVTSYSLSEIKPDTELRYKTGMYELDRVLGGGIVKGSLVLLSGDPGIGKSTILLQICKELGKKLKILYVSGEESYSQIKLRADRLSVSGENLFLLCETDIEAICENIRSTEPDLVIIDSIQTMNLTMLNSSPGCVTQVRECSNMLMRTAKSLSIPIIMVGHVNKDGNIAGPKVLEHIVDAVLYFEGERNLSFRILRAVKNRFGSTNEIGVFEMHDTGLMQVTNPSVMFLEGRPVNISGTSVICTLEGSRPILAEIQALVTSTAFGMPRRTSTGIDYNRIAMLIAVLEKRVGINLSNQDSYVNVIGGLRIDEPAADLGVICAIASAYRNFIIPDGTVLIGEVGLTGELRAVNGIEKRLNELEKLGFTHCIIPKACEKSLAHFANNSNIKITPVRSVVEALAILR